MRNAALGTLIFAAAFIAAKLVKTGAKLALLSLVL